MSKPNHVMRSAYEIRQRFASFLSIMVPIYIDHAMNEWDEPPVPSLNKPVRYDGLDPYEAGSDDYPMIGVSVLRTDNYHRIDFDDDGGNEYQTVHLCNLWIATKTRFLMSDDQGFDLWEQPPRGSVIARRDDLTGIVTNVLLAYPDLAINNEDSVITVDESSLQTTFVEPMKTGDPNVWVAVSQIGLSLKMREIAWVPPLSVVHRAIAQVETLSN